MSSKLTANERFKGAPVKAEFNTIYEVQMSIQNINY